MRLSPANLKVVDGHRLKRLEGTGTRCPGGGGPRQVEVQARPCHLELVDQDPPGERLEAAQLDFHLVGAKERRLFPRGVDRDTAKANRARRGIDFAAANPDLGAERLGKLPPGKRAQLVPGHLRAQDEHSCARRQHDQQGGEEELSGT